MFSFMKRIIIIQILFSFLFAAFEHSPSSPANIATGLLSTNIQTHSMGIYTDPASVNKFVDRHIGISSGQRFGLSLLNHGSAAWAQRFGMHYFGVVASFLGDKSYNETIYSLMAGKRFTDRMDVGIGLAYYGLSIDEYGSAYTFGLNLGWNIYLDETLQWNGSLRNVNSPKIGVSKDPLPQIFSSSLVYQPMDNTVFAIEIEQDTVYESRLKFGTNIRVLDWMNIFLGHASSPEQTTGGFEILYKQFNINYAVTTHTYLGLSHWIGTGIRIP